MKRLMKNVVRKNRGWQKGHFRSNFHDYSTTMEPFSNSPSADARHSPRTQITGKPAAVLILAYWDSINYSNIKSSPLENALHVKTIIIACNTQQVATEGSNSYRHTSAVRLHTSCLVWPKECGPATASNWVPVPATALEQWITGYSVSSV